MDRYLAQHPQIFMAPAKELNYFAPDIVPPEDRMGHDAYFSLFAGARDEKFVGESSVFYMMSEEAATRIHAFNPEARVLIFLRNPVDFIVSHHSQVVFEGYEDITDLETALEAEAGRSAADVGRPHYYREKVRYYRRMALFSEQMERFLSVFGERQVHITLYDDLRDNTPAEYRKILEFLGVDSTVSPKFIVHNANKQMRSPRFMRFLRDPPRWARATSHALMPRPARRAIVEMLKRMNTKYVARNPLNQAVRLRLTEELAPEVERLEQILGRDLTAWRTDLSSRANEAVSITRGQDSGTFAPERSLN